MTRAELAISLARQDGTLPLADRIAISRKVQVALDRLDTAIQVHQPIAVFGLFSGGHDSFSSTYVASLHPAFTSVVHIGTNIGVPATLGYVRKTARSRKWQLIQMDAVANTNARGMADPQDYEEIVKKYGFPGPGGHKIMYIRLKERSLKRLARQFHANCRGKVKKRIMLVSGCRSQESTRRMGHVEEVQVDGRNVWVSPIHDWTKSDTSLCLELADQPRNPIVDLIHKSGECLCGAFAEPGELEELNLWPLTRPAYKRIKALEAIVKPLHGWGWGERPPKKGKVTIQPPPGFLCWSCQK